MSSRTLRWLIYCQIGGGDEGSLGKLRGWGEGGGNQVMLALCFSLLTYISLHFSPNFNPTTQLSNFCHIYCDPSQVEILVGHVGLSRNLMLAQGGSECCQHQGGFRLIDPFGFVHPWFIICRV